ncbi:hypothetical protein DS832_07845 [Bombilactobacillus bombi]|uniref:Uncharacterized protein n=1 Tax=Bombilactobacillus bombi TaxID=1303590 RepID=A0A3R6V5W5_9LACO|nr:hypothetical protein [Bombilactobacillus bombi]RHW45276.1 hypothetical protein DS832_07845 [Bombilactobacillus bombi]
MKRYVVVCGKYYFVGKNITNNELILKKGFLQGAVFDDLEKAKKIAESLNGTVKQLTLTNPE